MILLRGIGRLVSPPGPRGKLSVLIFHRVRPRFDPRVPRALHAEEFDRLLGWVKGSFNVLPPDEAVERLRCGDLPTRAMAITFDDGYADNAEVALPILLRHRLSAAFFIATDFLDGGAMWNDAISTAVRECELAELDLAELDLGVHRLDSPERRRAVIARLLSRVKYLPRMQREETVSAIRERCGVRATPELMMRSEQVRALRAAGMTVGGHTCSHPILSSISLSEARREIEDGKARLEAILGERVKLFAYPNGKPGKDYTDEHVQLVRQAGFEGAFSTGWGVSGAGADLFQLPRFTPWDRSPNGFVFRLIRNLVQPGVVRA
ncbi:polysaccharide deacetylase family protein [Azoarcus sp. PA01]|nr:polysaccharide deacetylase family protein [Azoarcus sp. PA01]